MWAVEVAGHRLFSASADKTIRVWDIESRRCERVLEDHSRPVLSLACADGKLFSGSYDYTIKVSPPRVQHLASAQSEFSCTRCQLHRNARGARSRAEGGRMGELQGGVLCRR